LVNTSWWLLFMLLLLLFASSWLLPFWSLPVDLLLPLSHVAFFGCQLIVATFITCCFFAVSWLLPLLFCGCCQLIVAAFVLILLHFCHWLIVDVFGCCWLIVAAFVTCCFIFVTGWMLLLFCCWLNVAIFATVAVPSFFCQLVLLSLVTVGCFLPLISDIMVPFHHCNRLFSLNLDVVYPFLQTVLAKVEWKFIRVKENGVFHGVSLNFHKMKSYLWTISDNMDAIP